MRLLLDTHVFLWIAGDPHRISPETLAILHQPETQIFLSMASIWEIGIKAASGKLMLEVPLDKLVEQEVVTNDITLLDITVHHVSRMMALPYHHRDPFDRILVSQAISETLRLVSADSLLDLYDIQRIW